jgi:hypothetical protein
MIPIVPTNTSPAKAYGDTTNSNLIGGGNNSNLTNILSDFEIAITETNQYRPIIEYNPGAEYRLINMNSSMNLNKLDISVFWKTHYGEFVPFKLQPRCAARVKIMFRHKAFNMTS